MAFLVRFNTIFGATIAVTKDLPDVEGDKLEGIETFSTRLGVAKVARVATAVLFLNYCGAVATALGSAPGPTAAPSWPSRTRGSASGSSPATASSSRAAS